MSATIPAMKSVQSIPETLFSEALLEQMRKHKVEERVFSYTEDDIIHYALSIGAKLPSDFHYLYEGHSDFSIIPTFLLSKVLEQSVGLYIPGIEKIDMTRVLHGEQYIEVYEPLPNSGTFTMSSRFMDLIDKGKFSTIIFENDIFDKNGKKVAMTQIVQIVLGYGGIVCKKESNYQILPVAMPKRLPDNVVEEETSVNQAAMFRLNGDKYLIHIDPSMSPLLGFKKPILHGLCSYGFSLRHVLKTYANNDSSLFRGMKAQFAKPCIPGDSLVTEMWCDGLRITFQTKVKETGSIILKGGFVDLFSVHEESDKDFHSNL